MKFEYVIVLLGAIVYFLAFRALSKKARLKIKLLASLIATLFTSLVLIFLSFLNATGLRFVVGLATLVILICLGGIELALRILLTIESKVDDAHSKKRSTKVDLQVKAAAFYVPFENIKNSEAVGNDPLITEEFWSELMNYRELGMFKRDKYKTIIGNADISGTHINVQDGIRYTPLAPSGELPKCVVFGGSGVFAYEVPDISTPTAYLQSFINEHNYQYKVENHGVGGATIQDCLQRIKQIKLSINDVAIFVFGGNDVGVNTTQKIEGKSFFRLVPHWGTFLLLSKRYSKLAQILFDQTTELIFTDLELNQQIFDAVEKTHEELSTYLAKREVKTLFILQPNLYTKEFSNVYEQSLKNKYPKHWESTVLAGYRILTSKLGSKPNVELATHIFDGQNTSPYLDWGHLNSIGNKCVAQFIFKKLVERNLL